MDMVPQQFGKRGPLIATLQIEMVCLPQKDKSGQGRLFPVMIHLFYVKQIDLAEW